jgi:hypothetical protein
LNMMKMNMVIHTIHLNLRYREHELFRHFVIPYLVTNRFQPRVRAIQRTRPIPYRAKVLGRALLAARIDANRFWMLLSGNAEVAFASRSTTIAAAANLPTPATSVAVTTCNCKYFAAIAASVTSALETTATHSLPAAAAATTTSTVAPPTAFASDASIFAPPAVVAAANVATPSFGQRRNARP